jgi:DNA-binding MarR family transcriptional regulator
MINIINITGAEMMENRQAAIWELTVTLRTVFRSIRKEMNTLFGEHLTSTEYHVLEKLHREGTLRISELAQHFDVSLSHITSLTDQLENKGMVVRKRSEQDRRAVELHITDAGRRQVDLLQRKKDEYFRKKFSSLSAEEIQTLTGLLKKIV